jgi:outer membrane receptor for ferrienterochelin and colicin
MGNTIPIPYYRNQTSDEAISLTGFELELNANPLKSLNLGFNLSFRHAFSDRTLWFAPLLANLTATYTLLDRIDLTLMGQFVGSRSGTLSTGTRLAATDTRTGEKLQPEEKTYSAYLQLHFQVMLRVTRYLRIGGTLKNLTNTQWQYPEYVRQIVPYLPGGPGIQAYATAQLTY